MLPSAHRLHAPAEFRRVYGRGRSYVDPLLVLYVVRKSERNQRFGFSVSKKLGGAPQRNRLRRRLQEICRLHVGSLRMGFDAVVVARSRARTAAYDDLQRALLGLFGRSKLIAESRELEASPCGESASE